MKTRKEILDRIEQYRKDKMNSIARTAKSKYNFVINELKWVIQKTRRKK